MSEWHTVIHANLGQPTATEIANALNCRDKHLAANGQTATAEDDTVWTLITSVVSAFLTAVDPAGMARSSILVAANGLEAGYPSSHVGLSMNVEQPNAPSTVHHWQSMTRGAITPAEQAFALDHMHSHVLAEQGEAATAYDDAVFNALIVAVNSLLAVLDPATTGSDETEMSALVGVTGLSRVAANLTVSVAHQELAAGGNRKAVATAPLTSSSLVLLSSIPELGFAVAANKTYRFQYDLIFRSPGSGAGLAFAIGGPVGAALVAYEALFPRAADGTASLWEGSGTAFDDVIVSNGVPAANTDFMCRIFGIAKIGATPGTILPKFRLGSGSGTVTIQAASYGEIDTF